MDPLRFQTAPPDTRMIQNQPTSTADSPSDEPMADTDEPPDEQHLGAPTKSMDHLAAEFKKVPCTLTRQQSLLTRTFHTSDSDSGNDDEEMEAVFSSSNRAHSSASTWSRGSVASTAELTSDGHDSPLRIRTPSPPLPPTTFQGLPPVFNQKPFEAPTTVKIATESIDPLRKSAPLSTNEDAVEKGLGRKRCIMFACGGKAAAAVKKEELPKVEEEKKPEAPAKRPCALKFVCPSRGNTTPTPTAKPHIRLASPPPPSRRVPPSPRIQSPKMSRSHRSSDSTVRNDSPKSVRKVPSVPRGRRPSNVSEVPISEATRFHEFASSEEERDDWTQEVSCHRQRLTVQDTLKVENKFRQLGEEAEDEAMEEEEAEEELDAMDDEEEDIDEDEDDDNQSLVDSTGYVTDEGFHTDDEEGFAGSDDESDAGSDFAWWAPRTPAGEHVEHIRSLARRTSDSGSSIGSFCSTRVFPSKTPKALKRSKTNPIEFRPRTPELPDSTDFVCGTLDEDKPLEEAWLSCRNQRRAANHRPCPQDIDPTFPTSDPELDEEDEEGYEDVVHMDDSDHHFLIHGHPELMSDIDAREPRSTIPKKRSPAISPKRIRSPPPAKRAVLHHSPPPRRLFGHSPRRMHSPAPRRPLHSPPPSRRTSFTTELPYDINATPIALAQRPRFSREACSLPRNGPFPLHNSKYFNQSDSNSDGDNGEETQTDALPTRTAIDIVKGLEKKRQRRKEKLYEKHCRMRNKSKTAAKQPLLLPGMGAEKMRQMGEGLCKIRGHGAKRMTEMEMMFGGSGFGGEASNGDADKIAHILSY